MAQPLNVLTVDCTPFVSPGFGSFGPQLTMGMALQSPLVDPGNLLFNVNEVTPAFFQGMTANQLAAFDLIAINNLNSRLNCPAPDGVGLGTTWHSVVGVIQCGGRVLLSSHDAPRFHITAPPNGTPMGFTGACPGCEPFGTDELVRDAALWAGSGPGTGLVIFNDSQGFNANLGWANLELSLPVAWGITDSLQGGGFPDGGYTQILPAYLGHPVYANVSDVRLAPNSINSFAANISDTSFHSIFGSFNGLIFTPTEVVTNANVVDVGGFNAAFGFGFFIPAQGPDGTPITLIRECDIQVNIDIKPGSDPNGVNPRSKGVIPVAVLGSVEFDVGQVDPATVSFGPTNASAAHNGHVEDVNDDNFPDLVFHFRSMDTGIACGDTDATLTGEIVAGTSFTGTDAVKTAGCK